MCQKEVHGSSATLDDEVNKGTPGDVGGDPVLGEGNSLISLILCSNALLNLLPVSVLHSLLLPYCLVPVYEDLVAALEGLVRFLPWTLVGTLQQILIPLLSPATMMGLDLS